MRKFLRDLVSVEMLPLYGLILLLFAIEVLISYAERNGYLDDVKKPVAVESNVHPSDFR